MLRINREIYCHLFYKQIFLLLYIVSSNVNFVKCTTSLTSSESGSASIFDPNHPFSSRNIIQDISNKDTEITFTKIFGKGEPPIVSHHTARNIKFIKSSDNKLHNAIISSFTIKCCDGSYPMPLNSSVQQNFTFSEADYEIEELDLQPLFTKQENTETYCKLFSGNFTILEKYAKQPRLLDLYNATCKCQNQKYYPEIVLDSSCRQLPKCLNNGYRSFHSNNKCKCPQPFFGYLCEKKCEKGSLYKDHFGIDICSCHPYYQGSECSEIICLNGGSRIHDKCACLNQFLGYHCEIDTNSTIINPRMTKYSDSSSDIFSRDVSGTIFSLVMIIVLVISMYLLMKHRMQSQNRYIPRRPDLLGGYILSIGGSSNCSAVPSIHGNSQRRTMHSMEGCRGYQFRNMVPVEGPPAYYSHDQRRVRRGEILPPLPSYEDATKLPPLKHGGINMEVTNELDDTPVLINEINENQEPSSTSLLCNSDLPISTEINEGIESVITKSLSLDNEALNLQNVNKCNNTPIDRKNYQDSDNGSLLSQKNNDSKKITSDTD
uniref:EGF-like domain-containing protein n=1 Tax=Strongyloides venezuelensis TaxID=75913 RepID=A0A0K0FKH8_STRVS